MSHLSAKILQELFRLNFWQKLSKRKTALCVPFSNRQEYESKINELSKIRYKTLKIA